MSTRERARSSHRCSQPSRARAILALALAVLLAVAASPSVGAQVRNRLFIVQYDLVSQAPVTGGTDYTFRARLYNFGPAISGATARLVGTSTAGLVTDDTLVFGPIGRNQGAWSNDTATFRRTGRWRDLFGDFRWSIAVGSVNRPPVADAGPDRPAAPGDSVGLDGSGSSDADGDPLTFAWTLVSAPAGSVAVLENPTTVAPQLVTDYPGDYVVQLIVSDGTTNSAPDLVTVSTQNAAPVALAGPDQTVVAGQTVTLDGLGSYDPDGDPLTYRWTLSSTPSGSTASLVDPNAAVLSFTADRPGDYVLRLIVNDGWTDSAADTAVVSTTNSLPVANAGPDQQVTLGSIVMIDGSGSSDADAHPLTYAWTIISAPLGSAATLVGDTTSAPQLTPDVAGTYVVQLIVNDGYGAGSPDSVRIDVTALPTVTVEAIDASASEAGLAPGIVRLSRSGPLGTLRVILTASGSASNGADYDPLGGASFEVELPAGVPSVDVTIRPRPDNLVERPDEVATITILPSGAYLVGSQDHADITITDDPPLVTIVAGDPTAAEFGVDGLDTGRFDISRAGGDITDPLTVALVMSGTATPGTDYQGLTGSPVLVTIPANQSQASIALVPIADGIADANETATATVIDTTNYLAGSPASATVTIR